MLQIGKWFTFLGLTGLIFLSIPTSDADARRRGYSSSRGSRSSVSRRSRSRSRSSWGSSRYSRKGGVFSRRKSSSLGRTRSKASSKASRSINRSRTKTTATRTSTRSRRASRTRTRRTRRPSYNTYRNRYRNNPRVRQQRSWWNRPSRLKSRWRTSPRYTYGFYPRYYTMYPSIGIWDIYFLSHASHLFWYHHWHEPAIQRALYQDNLMQDKELARLQAKVEELEEQGVERNPDYLPDDVNPEDAFSDDYIEQIKREEEASGLGLWLLGGLLALGLGIYFMFIKRY